MNSRHHAAVKQAAAVTLLAAAVYTAMAATVVSRAEAQAANWIWTSRHEPGNVPHAPAHFRKQFTLESPSEGELIIAADDEFQVYLNGQLTGYGAGFDRPTKVILTPHLRDGDNLLAIRASNTDGSTAAMVAIMRFRQNGETAWRWLGTDDTWKSALDVLPTWINRRFDDSGWSPVISHGAFGTTMPWDTARMSPEATAESPSVAVAETSNADPLVPVATSAEKQFSVPKNFIVQRIMDPAVGSLIALEFNEFGQLILSVEGGSLLLADLQDAQNGTITVRKYCDAVSNIQGLLPLNGEVFVTGDGPDGVALYRLADSDGDGTVEPVQTLARFTGQIGEHGPHGLTLGPDGMIYVMIGNASGLADAADSASPVTSVYEGDLLPRIEDPGGHAVGIRAPGGTVVRVSTDGSRKELVAAGIRNAYDLAFSRHGDLFFHDSDMESDVGTPWYRPTEVFHLIEGGEYGWRSGTARFPAYFPDSLPPLADTGRGSPTGAVVYDHIAMPVRYHGALFLGDWSEGRILAVKLQPEGDSFVAEVEPFLSAQPLTVTDLAVGPDGALYFTTGGRGTEGGVYRVAWDGQIPESFSSLDDPVKQLVGRPQPQSAWTRQELARLQMQMGEQQWSGMLRGIMKSVDERPDYRIRAFEVLSLYGPVPTTAEVIALANDTNPVIRARAASALGWRSTEAARGVLLRMLADGDGRVRRAACHALAHRGIEANFEQLAPLLASTSRSESFAARRLLETMNPDSWRQAVLETDDVQLFARGATALMVSRPNLKHAYDVLARVMWFVDQPLNDQQLLEVLRVTQLALQGGTVDPAKIPALGQRMVEMFPARDGQVNRELARVLGYLQVAETGQRLPPWLSSNSHSRIDKLQVLLDLRGLAGSFSREQRLAAIAFLEESQMAAHAPGEGNYSLYVARVIESWLAGADGEMVTTVLQNGVQWPSADLQVFYLLPETIDEHQVASVIEMDRQLKGRTETAAIQARLGCIAVLGRNGDGQSMSYLREIWRHEPQRRDDVTLALAQQPDGPNWPYLIKSLGEVSDDTTQEVLAKLATVNKRPGEPEYLRNAIVAGYRLRADGADSAIHLLRHWTGNEVEMEGTDWRARMKAWGEWFNEQYPDAQPVEFDDESAAGNYSVDQIISFIETNRDAPDLNNGMLVFSKAQCAACHRLRGQGSALGPDLAAIEKRFSQRETVRAILHPHEYVSDQYASSKLLLSDGRQLTGVITRSGEDYVVLQSDGKSVTIAATDVDEIQPLETSVMPEGLLDGHSLTDIHDLMAWMYSTDKIAAKK